MTREEAFELFDLTEDSTSESILQKYRDMYSEYYLRLTNAPTSHLKKIYTQNIRNLEEAFTLLCPGTEVDESQFLPTDKPILDSPGNGTSIKNPMLSNKVEKESGQGDSNEVKSKKKASRINIMALVSLILFTLGVYAIIVYFQRAAVINQQELIIKELMQDTTALRMSLKTFTEEGRLIIRNSFPGMVKITWIMSIYNEKGMPKCYVNNIDLQIRPGEQKQLLDQLENWEGETVFYSLYFETETESSYVRGHVSGIWAQDQINSIIVIPPRK